jgi:hypothetical protein
MNNLFIALLLFLIACGNYTDRSVKKNFTKEIYLGEEMANPHLQISGMDWYGDKLVLLTQSPEEFDAKLFYVLKNEILGNLRNEPSKISVSKIHLNDKAVSDFLNHRNEYEAIAFKKDMVFLVIEIDNEVQNIKRMESWIVRGEINSGDTLTLDVNTLKKLPLPKKNIEEMACEAISIMDDSVFVFYEANGANLNKPANCFRLDLALKEVSKVNIDPIEYRITDATRMDKNKKFWVINSLYKGDVQSLQPVKDDLLPSTIGSESNEVKRLVRLHVEKGRVKIADKKTLMLEPSNWNWEGLVQLDKIGFLIINDTYSEGKKRTNLVYINKEIE